LARVRVGACQTWEVLGDVDEALHVVRDFAGQADAAGVDLLLFPECFLQGYLVTEEHVHGRALEVDSVAFAAVLEQLVGVRPTLVLGMIEHWHGLYFNTALVILGGRVVGRYRKSFLTGGGAQMLLVPAQNMMRRDKAMWWQDRHNEIRTQRVRETGLWLASADVTGQRDETRIGLGPTCVINSAGQVVSQVPTGTTGMAIAELKQS
jgi:predicted amidohydrolase